MRRLQGTIWRCIAQRGVGCSSNSGRILSKEQQEYTSNYLSSHALEPPQVSVVRQLIEGKRPALPDISISAMQGMFLHMLALAAPSKTLVEVGTLGGYSAAWLACAISGGSLHTIERDAKRAAFAQQNLHAAGLASRVHVINEPALDAICKLRATMQDGSVGLVFLDAQKSEYISYFQQLERLVAPGGWVVADNCLGTRRVWIDMTGDGDRAHMHEFNEFMARQRQQWDVV